MSKSSTAIDDQRMDLNFANADVADVARAVLGTMLGLNYIIDPSVSGTMTFRSNQAVPRSKVLPLLEQALQASGVALIVSHGIYHLVPLSTAPRITNGEFVTEAEGSSPGFGTEIIPLNFVNAADMVKLLAPLVPEGVQVQGDEARNSLIVRGTSAERDAVAENVGLLDVDYLSGMSFAIVPVNEASPSAVTSELESAGILKGSPLDGLVRVVPLERMHSILVVGQQSRYISEVQNWISRLDHGATGDQQRIFVYQVQNGRAQDLAATLLKLVGVPEPQSPGGSGAVLSPPQFPAVVSGSGPATTGSSGLDLSPSSPLNGDLSSAAPSQATAGSNGLRISADETNNAVVFYGTASQFQLIHDSLRQLDLPPLQVMLEAAIAEVTLTKQLNFGVQYSYQDSHNQILNTIGGAAIAPTLPGAAYTFVSGQNIKVILTALAGITAVNVISAPKLLVLNNQPAKLDVGEDVPVSTQTAQSTVSNGAPVLNSIEYRSTGVILKVTPRVNESGQVQMDIEQEVSGVAQTTTSTLNSPTFDERKISSTVSVQDGETVAMGGLITDNRSNGTSGIPYLQQIPLLGTLFSQKSDSFTRTELLVLITPHVVQTVQRLRLVTAELRSHMGEVEALLER